MSGSASVVFVYAALGRDAIFSMLCTVNAFLMCVGTALGIGKGAKTGIRKGLGLDALRIIPGCVYGGVILLLLRIVVEQFQVPLRATVVASVSYVS